MRQTRLQRALMTAAAVVGLVVASASAGTAAPGHGHQHGKATHGHHAGAAAHRKHHQKAAKGAKRHHKKHHRKHHHKPTKPVAPTPPKPPVQTGAVTLYVAPQAAAGGNGTAAHPYATLDAARIAARSFPSRDVNVLLENGTYQLTHTFSLGAADSGSAQHQITYEAAPGAHPVVSGGQQVTGWTLSDPANGIYKAHVGDVDFRELWVDGQLETRARTEGEGMSGWTKTATGYTTTDTALASYKNLQDVEVVSRWGWMEYRCRIDSVTPGSSGTDTVTMVQPCWHNANLHEGQEIQTPSWIENAYELLDQPGEWYLDRSTGDVYYKPQPGQSLATAAVTVPAVQTLVSLDGTTTAPVSDVTFRGITFSYSNWTAPSSDDGMVEGQAGFRIVGDDNPTFDSTRLTWQKTPGAVSVSHGHDVTFTGDTFTHLGSVGLDLGTGSQGSQVVGNTFTDVAATGIQVGGTDVVDHHPTDTRDVTSHNEIGNNVVTDVADVYNGSVGILAGYTAYTTIEHNLVSDLPYSGISVGWGWGLTDQGGDSNYPGNSGVPVYTTPTTSTHTIVRDNVVHDIMKHQADGGAIYTLSASPDSEVSGNYIYDIPSLAYGAIYHDEGSRYFHTTQNAYCNVDSQFVLLNHGLDDVVDRNFTTNSQFSAQFNSERTSVVDNVPVGACDQLPASIVDNAGLQPAYQHLAPGTPATDTTAPTAPGTPVAAPSVFPGVVDLSWPAATDGTGVTGYSVFADGKLVGASAGTSTRITGLTPGATVRLTVTARDEAGNESAASQPVTVVVSSLTDLALNQPVTASSDSEDNIPSHAVDGDLSTRWAQGLGYPDPSWLQVDLGARYDLSGIVTTFEKGSGYKYEIEASDDGLTWHPVIDHTAANTTTSANYDVPSQTVEGRYVRVTITGSSGNGGSIWELAVYGTKAAPPADTQAPSVPGAPTATVLVPTVLDLSWPASTDDTAVTGYAVYDGDTQVALTADTHVQLENLTAGSTHHYSVVALDASGNASAPSPVTDVTLPDGADLALDQPVTVSSYSDPNVAKNAVDGDLTTRWAQGLGLPDPSWIDVDLGSVKTIGSVATTFELPSGYEYKIEYSTDDQSWSTFQDHTADRTTAQTNYAVADQPVQARYVRLTVTNSNWNGGSIYELQVYGAAS
jgi:hypothetical protein